jgi:hypothetical protein
MRCLVSRLASNMDLMTKCEVREALIATGVHHFVFSTYHILAAIGSNMFAPQSLV